MDWNWSNISDELNSISGRVAENHLQKLARTGISDNESKVQIIMKAMEVAGEVVKVKIMNDRKPL